MSDIRTILESFRKACVNKDGGPGFEQTEAALIAYVEERVIKELDDCFVANNELQPHTHVRRRIIELAKRRNLNIFTTDVKKDEANLT